MNTSESMTNSNNDRVIKDSKDLEDEVKKFKEIINDSSDGSIDAK
jgi:hypothetical protein